ncbi:MAG: ABC transporter ATP-binding protein [Clostridiales bacterium]|nr:ABC transporter ATP-binding protein [Clostridiales bacterium]
MQDEKPKRSKQSEKFIPEYDFLFEEHSTRKGKKEKKFFTKLVKMNARPIIFSTLIYVLQGLPTYVMPLMTAYIIDVVTASVEAGGGVTADVWRRIIICSVLLLVVIAQNVPTTIWRFKIVSKMARRTSAGIKSTVVRKLQSLSITYHKDMQTGKIQSKFLKDTDSVDGLFHTILHSIIPNILGVIIATTISVCKNGIIALFFLLVIPCNVGISFVFRKKMRKVYREFRLKTEKVSSKLSNMLEMMPVTKSHGLEQTEIGGFNKSITQLAGAGMEVDMNTARFGSASWVINQLLSAICLIFCSVLALNRYISIGDIVLYQTMFTQISGYVSNLVNMYPSLASGTEALNSVSEIMNAEDVEITIGKAKVPAIKGAVEFENLSYRYPNTEQFVVKDFSLSVKPGECIAVVGASGSGKSTIMNLIIGFLTAEKGDLKIDGKSIKDFNLSEYRHHISVVPQSSILFSGTIRDNITYGLSHYKEKELQKVVEMANLNEFIKDLPNGLDTDIGEHGDKLSGGQKQRITIARALIRNPKILILDEATSALDNISEYHVQKAISSSIRGRTTFIVAHRLSTIRDADRIVVMDQGVAVESGTFEELMAKKGKFYELKCLNDLNLKQAEENLA